ncbi:MAG: RAD55 family ATPase, partial [Thermoplasmata archaeon]
IPSRPYVISGPRGSGKTILASHYLVDGLKRGEACLLVALDEPPSEIKANMASFGWKVDELTTLDATPDIRQHKRKNVIDVGTTLDVRGMDEVKDVRKSVALRTMEVTIHSVQKMIKQSAKDHVEAGGERYTRIVIDSMTALRRFSLRGDETRILVQSFLRFLSELEVTTLIVSNPLDPTVLDPESLLARGELLMHKWIDGSAVRRAVSVERMRGTGFDERMRPLVIGARGITVYADTPVATKGPLFRTIGTSFLENRLSDEVTKKMDEVLGALEAVRKADGDTSATEGLLLRAVVAMQRKRFDEALRLLTSGKAKMTEEIQILEAARRAKGRSS